MGVYFNSSDGHQCISTDFRIEDETFSRHTVQTDEVLNVKGSHLTSVHYPYFLYVQTGEVLNVKGSLVNLLATQQQLKLGGVITDSNHTSFSYDFFRIYLEPASFCSAKSDGNIDWYFQLPPNHLEELILKPNDVMEYSVSFIPQKAGIYRIHSAVLDGDDYRIGPGRTIIVEGNDEVTHGEIFGFYLPFSSSLVLIISGSVVGMILLKRKFRYSKIS